MSAFPQFTATPVIANASVAAGANTNLLTAGMSGTRIDAITAVIKGVVPATGGVLRVYLTDPAKPGTTMLIDEIAVGMPGTTGVATVGNTPASKGTGVYGITLPYNWILSVANTAVGGGGFDVTVFGGNY